MKSLQAAYVAATLPGGSNTVFATVKHVADLMEKGFQTELDKLPDQLTIVVNSSKPDA
jgi:hypothetical protein